MNPAYLKALTAPSVMTIPANIEHGTEIRPLRRGPVFSVCEDGRLHMCYTARTRSIKWKTDADTQATVTALQALLASEDPFSYRLMLQSGWGLISSNVLHDRSGFNDDESQTRLLYRRSRWHLLRAKSRKVPCSVEHDQRRQDLIRAFSHHLMVG